MTLTLKPVVWGRDGHAARYDLPTLYEVLCLPPGREATINFDGHDWRLQETVNGVAGVSEGDYESADAALTVQQGRHQ